MFAQAEPWWVPAITGSAGTLIVMGIGMKVLWSAFCKKDNEVSEVTKESITVITRILERVDASAEREGELRTMITKIIDHNSDDLQWKNTVMDKVNSILTKIEAA